MKENKVECVPNEVVVEEIKSIKKDPDTDYGYIKMTYYLLILGYLINHKKVYRLMDENQLLHERYKKLGRTFVKYRKVMLTRPLQVLEMDIKVVWVEEFHHNAYILTVIDTFTRFALGYRVGYSIGKHIVKELWEEIIEKYLQPYDCLRQQLDIEIRNYQLSGNMSLREVPCPHPKSLDGIEDENLEKEMSGAETFPQPSSV
ncbi:MAG TPA: IS3 family transposase [Bacteroidales bacterium]|nr:MAG: Integrase core domain protein [Bacteroidetes bacterium ADurb.Bin012]HNU62768.1 IS3 family transposase [Methanofastidiosum sp.]HNV62876.1 IS3 family transposase [Candidatus Cloacimonas acidaminovorans]HPC14756.1 IS3 family transposase [Bacteroidales bacterium]HPN49920.1 IS3 family transposase [Bacteroidales bacterium]